MPALRSDEPGAVNDLVVSRPSLGRVRCLEEVPIVYVLTPMDLMVYVRWAGGTLPVPPSRKYFVPKNRQKWPF